MYETSLLAARKMSTPPKHATSPPPSPPAKTTASRRTRRLTSTPFVVAFAAVAVGFVASTIYGEVRASAIDREAAQIETNALPSVEALAAARAALRHLEVESDRYADETGDARNRAGTAMDRARADIARQFALEAGTEMYPGEATLVSAATRALEDLDGLLSHLRALSEREGSQGGDFAEHDVRDGVERADAALGALMALNTLEAHAEITRISGIRADSIRYAFVLELASVSFAVAAAIFALRSLRRQRQVELAHQSLLEERAGELEIFASRVAHDLLGPLSALGFTLSLLKRNAEKGLPIAEPIERANACLKRSRRLVDGVLEFARSGASTVADERASLRETLDGVIEEVHADAMGAELVTETFEDVVVACSPGILTSVLSNLLRNAVKYMDGRPDRRVTVRVTPSDSMVHVEVEDTGPGLPPGLEAHVFEPYVRAPDNPTPGLGLGLATVRRFVESYRGRVGVRSDPGHGCVFWFEMPRGAPARNGNDVTGR
jgi:signal transduction histidine kinase